MEQIISQEEFTEIKKAKGEMRGNGPKTIGDYILKKEGENGLQKIEEIMKLLGYPIEYRKINQLDYYPMWLAGVTLLAAKRLFNFTNEDFQKMGEMDVKFTPIQRFFTKYFISLKKASESSSKIFSQYHTQGKLELVEFNEKEKYGILRIMDFGLNEYHCHYMIGYIAATAKMVSKNPISCEETQCPFRGGKYHDFKIKW